MKIQTTVILQTDDIANALAAYVSEKMNGIAVVPADIIFPADMVATVSLSEDQKIATSEKCENSPKEEKAEKPATKAKEEEPEKASAKTDTAAKVETANSEKVKDAAPKSGIELKKEEGSAPTAKKSSIFDFQQKAS